MIDVFVRVWPQSRLRQHLAEAVLERIQMQEDAHLRVLLSTGCEPGFRNAIMDHIFPRQILWPRASLFAKDARQLADAAAESEIYAIIDDDHLPIGKDWIREGVAALERHPEYAMLSAWSVNGEVRDPGGDDEVFPASSSGTPCFIRKGTFVGLPDAPAPQYDIVLSEWLKSSGWKIGFLRHVRFNHLGHELSQVVPGHWSA